LLIGVQFASDYHSRQANLLASQLNAIEAHFPAMEIDRAGKPAKTRIDARVALC
jgi:hypothetical protein